MNNAISDPGTEAGFRAMIDAMFLTPEQRLPAPFYQDEFSTLYHGNCRDILPLLPQFDLLCTDPPYGHGDHWQGGTWSAQPLYSTVQEWDAEKVDQDLLDLCLSKGKQGIVWGGNYYRFPLSRCWLSWVKTQRIATLADFELAWTSLDRPAKLLIKERNPDGQRQHPTQKPLDVMRWCLGFSPGSVCDPFAGSGSTLVAAKSLGRQSVGIEIDEGYCKIAAERLAGTTPSLFHPPPAQPHQEAMFPDTKRKRR